MKEHSTRKHALLSASGSDRWINCPASFSLEEFIKNQPNYFEIPSIYAEEGTLAHELTEYCLFNNLNTKDLPSSNSFEIKCKDLSLDYEDLSYYVQLHLDYVRSKVLSDDTVIYTEKNVDFSHIVEDGFGIVDTVLLEFANKVMDVIDLKFGKGIEVNAVNNYQLLLYAIGFIKTYLYDKDLTDLKIRLRISQPRLNNYSTWELTYDELQKHTEFLKIRSQEALSKDAKLIPGEKQCRWCKVKDKCPALLSYITDIYKQIIDCPLMIKLEEKRFLLDNAELVQNFIYGLKAEVTNYLENGGKYQGYKLVEGRSIRVFTEDAEDKLYKIIGDVAFSKKLKGITEIEKLLGKKELNELNITIKPKGKPSLVKETDKRESLGFDNPFTDIS